MYLCFISFLDSETLQSSLIGKNFMLYTVNIMAADDLAIQGTRSSAAMVLTELAWNNPVSAPEGLTHHDPLT